MPEIARLMGFGSMTSVVSLLRQHGDPALLRPIRRRSKPHPGWWIEAQRLSDGDVPGTQIAAQLDKSPTAVNTALKILREEARHGRCI